MGALCTVGALTGAQERGPAGHEVVCGGAQGLMGLVSRGDHL